MPLRALNIQRRPAIEVASPWHTTARTSAEGGTSMASVCRNEEDTSQRCARAEFGSLNVAFGREREVVGDALETGTATDSMWFKDCEFPVAPFDGASGGHAILANCS